MKLELTRIAVVALGGALGAGLRYTAAEFTHHFLGREFPYGTLAVNVLGSMAIGYLLVLMPEADEPLPWLRLLLITGVLGGFTTYSAFSVETLQLVHGGEPGKAVINILATVVVCLVAVWVGYGISRGVHGSA